MEDIVGDQLQWAVRGKQNGMVLEFEKSFPRAWVW